MAVNRNSPARYLNEDRFADVELPDNADGDSAPDWEIDNRDGQYEWHDHRIHWMSDAALPPAVTDTARETKVFDWRVPLRAGQAGRGGVVRRRLAVTLAALAALPAAAGLFEPPDAAAHAVVEETELLYLESVDALWKTAFGRAILVKAALFAALVGFGAYHRRRSLPALREIAARRARPGRAGVALRRALLCELALFAGVLVATAALVSYSPSATAGGPFSDSIDLGPAQLEITVAPASPGDNEIHVYLFDRRTGAQYDRPREFSLSAAQKELDIGPIELRVRKAGPGHYTVPRAPLAPTGDWTLEAKALISDFEELRGDVEVPIR